MDVEPNVTQLQHGTSLALWLWKRGHTNLPI